MFGVRPRHVPNGHYRALRSRSLRSQSCRVHSVSTCRMASSTSRSARRGTRSSSSTRQTTIRSTDSGARGEARKMEAPRVLPHVEPRASARSRPRSRRCRSACSSSHRSTSQEFNLRHGRRGALVQGRYKARPRRDERALPVLPAVLRNEPGAPPASATGPRTGRGAATRASSDSFKAELDMSFA